MADFEVRDGGVTLRVNGVRKLLRAAEKAGADAQDMRDLMHDVGQVVVDGTSAPDRSGTLAGTVRAGRGKTKAVVRAGGARAKYAGVIHYGWPARNIAPQPYLVQSLQANRGEVLETLDRGIDEILQKNNLK